MDDAVWNHSTFTKNRDRLIGGKVARRFFSLVLGQADRAGLLSQEHFSVDGALIEALASLKSYRPKDEDGPPSGGGRNADVDFHGDRWTHQPPPGYAVSQRLRKVTGQTRPLLLGEREV